LRDANIHMQAQFEGIRDIPRRMTEEEFDAWMGEDIWAEFRDGEVITRMPALLKHEALFKFLLILLDLFVTRCDLGFVIGSQYTIRLRPGLRHIPDLMFISKARLEIVREQYVEGAPDLVIEIVSPDSVARDWRDKYAEYQNAGVAEYWVFDPHSQHAEWYHLNPEGRYDLLPVKEGAFHSLVLPGFFIREEWLWQDQLPDPFDKARELGIQI